MDLSTLYTLAKSHASYADFRNQIDKQMTGTPETVLSKNEFTLIVENRGLADVITSASFRKVLQEAIESGEGYDYCWNGEDEYPVNTFDSDESLCEVLEVIRKHLL